MANDWQDYFTYGYNPIPLLPGTKKVNTPNWFDDIQALWNNPPAGFNIGLQMGHNGLCVIDADDKNVAGSTERIQEWLVSKGYTRLVIIRTPSGGHHFYFRLMEPLPAHRHVANLKPAFGAGELRFGPHAYVATVPSIIDGKRYELIEGDRRSLPFLKREDALELVNLADEEMVRPPVMPKESPDVTKRVPAWVLDKLQNPPAKGKRSEVDASILLALYGQGRDEDDAWAIVQQHAGLGSKFIERGWDYFHRTWEAAARASETDSPTREKISELRDWAINAAWNGKGGATDRKVFDAILELAYRAGRLTGLACAVRDLSLLAGVGIGTVSNSLKRLEARGFIRKAMENEGVYASRYDIIAQIDNENCQYVNTPTVKKCSVIDTFTNTKSHDLFSRYGLGTAAAEIWAFLKTGSYQPDGKDGYTVSEIVQKTGRSRNTVRRVLYWMARLADPMTGEVMAVDIQKRWFAQDPNLDRIAAAVGLAGRSSRRALQYEKDRMYHKRVFGSPRAGIREAAGQYAVM